MLKGVVLAVLAVGLLVCFVAPFGGQGREGQRAKGKSGLGAAAMALKKSDLADVAGNFKDAGVGAKSRGHRGRDEGPDVKDSCCVQ